MPLYKIRRSLPGYTEDQLEAAALRAALCSHLFGDRVRWQRSFFDPARSEIHCIYEAEDPEELREHARLAHIPCDEITEVVEVLAEPFLVEADAQGGRMAPALHDLIGSDESTPAE
jgi:hypothetical protein